MSRAAKEIRTCKAKRLHPNFLSAMQHAEFVNRHLNKSPIPVTVYYCRFGDHFHTGHDLKGWNRDRRYHKELSQRLKNPLFLERAPAHIVALARERFEDLSEQFRLLTPPVLR